MRQRIVVKVGSNVLTRADGKLDVTRMSALVDQIACIDTERQRGDSCVVRSRRLRKKRTEGRPLP